MIMRVISMWGVTPAINIFAISQVLLCYLLAISLAIIISY